MHRPATAEDEVAAELAAVRPGLVTEFTRQLPGARAAVLTRLWRGFAHEPLPWVERRESAGGGLTVRLADGRRLHGPAADPYATADRVPAVELDGVSYDRPERLMAALAVPHGTVFATELAHSVASLALARAGRPDRSDHPDRPKEWPATDWEWEQQVVDGHPYHPNCRSRPGFSVADQLAYGPEHRPVVRLGLLAVPAEECLVSGSWPRWLRERGRVVLPVHPWQAEHVLERGCVEGPAAHPLMPVRTLALPEGPHVKTALSARLTSSVRDISVGSVRMAAALSAFAEDVAARTGGLLHVTRTLGAATAGSPDLAAVLRESPRRYAGPGEHVVPVAALPATGLTGSAAWTAAFARLALTVGLRLLQLGVALEAHGQNLLVVLSGRGEPLRLVYRDLADIRVGPARLARHGIALPELSGRIVTDDVAALRRKLFGSLVAGSLAATAGSGPALAAALAAAGPDLPDTPDLRALREQPLPAKALTLMRLSSAGGGDRWTHLPRPEAATGHHT
ncbi:IucA/IucC family siderophore biosynthesis protein [Streptomyces sp. MUM 2J]|uniref:IucA/IucC family siderophore biosynthesis protein n=1 Tax=Streptomyces sp. MUM 2J TaxID=2791987 RepID=UPI001F03D5E7|nr:IucA/IucC family siderophore biosynthesis protein [Streptomyces sp. MUM 2J]MCH0566040.1 IucA/IucC family siderophore biosynthesis protein [Streptomyces sp. MUM 2J]